MRALLIAHDHVSPAGPVGERLAERGYDLDDLLVVPAERFSSPDVEAEFPDPMTYDLIVPMGAVWSADDEARIGRWLLPERDLLRRAHANGVPVLGICFGGQALAVALGGGVERAPRAEIGWVDVETDEPDLVGPGPWFQFHYDRWLLPPGAVEIARSRCCVAGVPRRTQSRCAVPPRAHQHHPGGVDAVRRAGRGHRRRPGSGCDAGADPSRGRTRPRTGPPARRPVPRPGRRAEPATKSRRQPRCGHGSRKALRSASRRRHEAFIVSASSASGSRSCATATVDFDGPFSSNETLTRVEPPDQSKRAGRPGHSEIRAYARDQAFRLARP